MKLPKTMLFIFCLFATGCALNNKNSNKENSDSLELSQKLLLTEQESYEFLEKYDFSPVAEERKSYIKAILSRNIDGFYELSPVEVIDILGVVSMEKENGHSSAWYYYYENCNIIIAWEKYIDNEPKISAIKEYSVSEGMVKNASCLEPKVTKSLENTPNIQLNFDS